MTKTRRTERSDSAISLATLFRLPSPGMDWPADIRRLLDPDEPVDDASDAQEDRRLDTPKASFAAGMALCIPSLILMGLLYMALK